jgi:hypothetical protein
MVAVHVNDGHANVPALSLCKVFLEPRAQPGSWQLPPTTGFDAMQDDDFASFPKFESAPAAPPAAEQPQAVPAAQRPQTAPAAEQKVRVVGIKDAGEKKAAPSAAAAGGSVSSSWGGWGGGWLSSAASAMPQSTAALEGMTSLMSVGTHLSTLPRSHTPLSSSAALTLTLTLTLTLALTSS